MELELVRESLDNDAVRKAKEAVGLSKEQYLDVCFGRLELPSEVLELSKNINGIKLNRQLEVLEELMGDNESRFRTARDVRDYALRTANVLEMGAVFLKSSQKKKAAVRANAVVEKGETYYTSVKEQLDEAKRLKLTLPARIAGQIKPITALKTGFKNGWGRTITSPESQYISDGTAIMTKDRVNKSSLSALEQKNSYRFPSGDTDEKVEGLFTEYTNKPGDATQIIGYVEFGDPIGLMETDSGKVYYVAGSRLSYMVKMLRPDALKIVNAKSVGDDDSLMAGIHLVFVKGGEDVALITMMEPPTILKQLGREVVSTFRNLLDSKEV